MGVGGQHHTPAALPPGKTRNPLYRRLGGSQSRSGQVLKISPPQRDSIPWTVQPVASRYTDWDIAAAIKIIFKQILSFICLHFLREYDVTVN